LEQLSLPAPVVALVLKTGRAEAVTERNGALFRDSVQPEFKEAMDRLIERLRGRFGSAHIYGINLVEEHRPEAAWEKSADLFSRADAGLISPWADQRPLWILPSPLSLPDNVDGLPRYHGREPLKPQSGPERIEAGWWGDEEICRDYYMAVTSRGEKLWIYRDCRAGRGWYLHGIFG